MKKFNKFICILMLASIIHTLLPQIPARAASFNFSNGISGWHDGATMGSTLPKKGTYHFYSYSFTMFMCKSSSFIHRAYINGSPVNSVSVPSQNYYFRSAKTFNISFDVTASSDKQDFSFR